MSNEDTYAGESGLIADFDGVIADAWFATDARINNGNTVCLFLQFATDHPDADEGRVEERYPCGPDWESLDGGQTVEHPKGKTKFNYNSRVQRFINAAVEAGAGSVLASRGPAQDASVWKGLRFHMDRLKYEYKFEGKTGESEYLGPVAFLGIEGEAVSGSPSTSQTGDVTPAQNPLEGVDGAIVEQLRAIKSETENHQQFVDRAMELTDVTSTPTLVMALASPDDIYASL